MAERGNTCGTCNEYITSKDGPKNQTEGQICTFDKDNEIQQGMETQNSKLIGKFFR